MTNVFKDIIMSIKKLRMFKKYLGDNYHNHSIDIEVISFLYINVSLKNSFYLKLIV